MTPEVQKIERRESMGVTDRSAVTLQESASSDQGKLLNVSVVTIKSDRRWHTLARELWEYRELLYFLTWRAVKVRYKQTIIGGAWAVIQPLMTMVVFAAIFGRFARIPSEGGPYP